jgi:hypothetical protein
MILKKGWLGRQLSHVTNDVQTWPEWMKREAGFGEYRSQAAEKAQEAASQDEKQQARTATARPTNGG